VKLRGSIRGITAFCLLSTVAVIAAQSAHAAQALQGATISATASCSSALQRISLSPVSVPGGAASTVTATLSCAPSKAVSVSLTGFIGVKVPSAVRVAAGKTSATGTITTATRKKALRGWITGRLGRVSQRAPLTVGVTPKTCRTTALSAISLPSLTYVGDHPVLEIKLTCTPSSAVRLTLKSTGTNLSGPASVTIGAYYNVVDVALAPKAYQPGQYKSTVSVHYGGKTLTKTITVDPGLSLLQVNASSDAPNSLSPDLALTGDAPAGGITVKLASSSSAVVVPSSVTIPQGAIAIAFGVTTQDVTTDTKVTISATFGGRTLTQSATLLAPWTPSDTLTIIPETSAGPIYGQSADDQYTLQLSNPAPSSGLAALFSTDSPDASVQLETAYISQGFATTSFEANFAAVTSAVTVHLIASVDGVTTSLPVTLEPGITAVTAPATIVSGQSATGTVTLAGPVSVVTTVALQSDMGVLRVPSSEVIQPGQSSVTFPITTSTGAAGDQVSIQADINGDALATTVTLS
jgi:hypothetical protein